MLRLRTLGWGKKQIAAELSCSRNTVKRYLAAGGWAALPGERRAVLPTRLEFPRQNRHHRIVTQGIVIVQVFTAQCDREDTLADQGRHLMFDIARVPFVLEARRESLHHPDRPVRRTQKECAASDVIAPPSNAATTSRPSTGANPRESLLYSVCIGALRESSKIIVAQ